MQGYYGYSDSQIVDPLLQDLLTAHYVAFDIETDTDHAAAKWPNKDFGLSFVADPTVVSFSWRSADTGLEINSLTFGKEGLKSDAYKAAVKHLLTTVDLIIAHNAVFDLRQLAGKPQFGAVGNGYIHGNVHDTMANARIIHPEKQQFFGMFYVANALGFKMTDEHLDAKSVRGEGHKVEELDFMKYCESDAVLTYGMYEAQVKLIDSTELYNLVSWENRASRAYCRMSARGVKLNEQYVKQRIFELGDVVAEAKANLSKDGLFEPSKKAKVAEYLYVTKRLPLPQIDAYSPFYTDKYRKQFVSLQEFYSTIKVNIVYEPPPVKTTAKLRKAVAEAWLAGDIPGASKLVTTAGFADYLDYTAKVFPDPIHLGVIEFTGRGEQPTVLTWGLECFSMSSDVMISYLGDTEEIDQFDDVAELDTDIEETDAGFFRDRLKALADYVTSSRMLTTLKMLLLHASYDGRIHSLVSVATHTGRRASQHPQVQNWHMRLVKGDPAGDMCGVAIGDPQCFLGEFDFNNAENRVAAMLAADQKLAEACMSNDFHAFCAAGYFGERFTSLVPKSKEWDDLRTMSKAITFGTAYGMGARTLAARLSISIDEAREILEAKDNAYPRVAHAKKQVQDIITKRAKGGRDGFINLWTGRKVMVSTFKAYKGWNYGCQGAVAEMVKRSIVILMEELEEKGYKSYPSMDMHDAIIMNIALDEYAPVSAMVSEIMEGVLPDDPYNNRTTPKMEWIADCDLKKNAEKWGKFQAHPKTGGIAPIPAVSAPVFPDKELIKLSFDSVEVNGAMVHKITLIDLDYSVTLSYPPFTALQNLTDDQITETLNAIDGAVAALNAALNATYSVQLPLDDNDQVYERTDGSAIYRSDVLLVSIDDWCSVPSFWARACEFASLDPVEITGVTAQKLANTVTDRTEWATSLRARLHMYNTQRAKITNHLQGLKQASNV